MPNSNESNSIKSSYEPIKKPDFKPSIPEFLLQEATHQDKFILEQLSVTSQYVDWLANTMVGVHEQVRKTNGRVTTTEVQVATVKAEVRDIKQSIDDITPTVKEIKSVHSVFKKKWVVWFMALGLIFLLFFIYPMFLTYEYVDLMPAITKFFGKS